MDNTVKANLNSFFIKCFLQRYKLSITYNTVFCQNPLAHHLSATHSNFQFDWIEVSYLHYLLIGDFGINLSSLNRAMSHHFAERFNRTPCDIQI